MMKRVVLLVAVLVGTSLPGVAHAGAMINTGDVITVVSQTSTISGGPFGIDGPDGGPAAPADFMSFCLEISEGVTVGSSYYVQLSDEAAYGGLGGGNPDPLSEETAFLYSRFVAGLLDDLTGNAYNDTQAATKQLSFNALQLAIWVLEDEAVFVNSAYRRNNGNVNGTPIGDAATWSLANTLIAAASANAVANNFYGVQVMQLWKTSLLAADPLNSDGITTNNTNAQDMLVTVPEAGSTLAVLMFGVGAVGASRFRFRRNN